MDKQQRVTRRQTAGDKIKFRQKVVSKSRHCRDFDISRELFRGIWFLSTSCHLLFVHIVLAAVFLHIVIILLFVHILPFAVSLHVPLGTGRAVPRHLKVGAGLAACWLPATYAPCVAAVLSGRERMVDHPWHVSKGPCRQTANGQM